MPVSTLISSHNIKRDVHESQKCSLLSTSSSASPAEVKYEPNDLNCPDIEKDNSITQSVIPINFPYDLNLSLNCVLVPATTLSVSSQNSPILSSSSTTFSSTSSFPNSLSIPSVSPISSASASPTSSSCSSSSGFYESSSKGRKYRLSIVKIEEEDEIVEKVPDSFRDGDFTGNNLGLSVCKKVELLKRGEEDNSTTSNSASTTAECDWDLDFDDVDFDEYYGEEDDDDDDDTDVEVTSSCIVSSPCTINTVSDSNSNSSFSNNNNNNSIGGGRKRKKKSKVQNNSSSPNYGRKGNSKSDDEEANNSDENEYLSLDNPNPVPCEHCQGNKDHFIDENIIWPIQLDLDLIETLVQLCPEFFAEFDEVEMEHTDGSRNSLVQDGNSSSNNTNSASQADILQDSQSIATSESGGCSSIDSNSMDSSSPPHVQVDDSPLQNSMDRNKESLKVKLLLRRPMNQLVEQGILPPPKTPPAFAGQRVRLERARMGDLLKAKIQQRPARQELIRQHILEDSNARVAPLLAEKQRMLKKARLADSLNDHLTHRPGPLELVQKNILHAPDAIIDQAIKEGAVSFKATCEGHVPGPQLPNSYLSEDDSSSDLSSPAGTPDQSQSSSTESSSKTTDSSNAISSTNVLEQVSPTSSIISPASASILSPAPPPPPPPFPKISPLPSSASASTSTPNQQIQSQILSRIVQAAVTSSTVPPLTSAQLTLSKLSQLDPDQLNTLMNNVSQNQGQRTFLVAQGINFHNQPAHPQHACASKSRSSKKSSKPKSQPKARQIKFHEYKGPPSAQKGQQQSQQQDGESSYELLLHQQQLFLQWQLEWQHKYPQIILPAVSRLTSPTEATAKLLSSISAAGATLSVHTTPTASTASISAANVLSPSTISSVSNSNSMSTCLTPVSSSGQITMIQSSPRQIPQNCISAAEVQPVPSVTASSSMKFEESKSNETNSNNTTAIEICEKYNAVMPSSSSPGKTRSLSKLNDWKVNDLRAELKRRNLPVSGSKPQLIERLKLADMSLQDESISTTTHNSKGVAGVVVKTEVPMEESTCYEMMDVSETQSFQKQISPNRSNAHVKEVKMDIKPILTSGSTSNTNAAVMALLQNNNIKLNADGSIPSYVLNALASVATRPNSKSSSSDSASTSQTSGTPQNIVFVDETIIREQRKHIEQLQEELKKSQLMCLQMKSQQGGAQKHRLALQQHLQHKMQQQALQAQLQKLQIQLQLHSLQQQQQQQNQNQPTKVQLSQVSTKIQPQFPHVQVIAQHPQRAVSQQATNTNQFILPKSAEKFSPQKSLANNKQTKIATPPNNNTNNNIPFAILKIATTTRTHLQTPDNDGLRLSDIPQILIPDEKDASFQVGKNDSSQGSNSIPVPPVSADQTDQSWLLKINELQEDSKSSSKEFSNFFDNIITTNDNASKPIEENQVTPTSNDTKIKKKNFKSQMVDDVLEILIRHGELPPSAAQEPQTPTTPGKSPAVLSYPRNPESHQPNTDGQGHIQPPPPPPLPPATFAVTLPTSISFPKPITASVFSGHAITPSAVSHDSESDPKSKSILVPSATIPTIYNVNLPNSETLSKEAQDILKISEDLSNFGRAHAQNENHNRILSSSSAVFTSAINKASPATTKLVADDDDNLSMLLGDVEKDLHLVDDMDVVLDDHSTSHGFHHSSPAIHGNYRNSLSNTTDIPMAIIDDRLHNHSSFQNYSNTRPSIMFEIKSDGMKSAEPSAQLLEELGTLISDDLDVTMPMEMDYSEWLEDLLPSENNSAAENSFNNENNHHMTLSPFYNATEYVNNDGSGMGSNNNFYGVNTMEFNSNNNSNCGSQRDPLLSSRSLSIFSSIPETTINGGNSTLNVINSINSPGDLKTSNNNRAPSPMAMGNDGLLWDFA